MIYNLISFKHFGSCTQ